ncbi:MAG: protein kinase [Phycisphaerales bacterium]|nr:protein kinase [Phycisphaerales bacterium]
MTDSAASACLDEHDLRRFCAHELSESAARKTRDHLEHCPTCAQRQADLETQHETWVRLIRTVGVSENGTGHQPVAPLSTEAIPGYLIEEEIKRGGQGIVFRAVQQSTRRSVAIKILRDGLLASHTTRLRFEREIEVVASLRHPHIVAVFDSGVTSLGLRYCVMDYIRGMPLHHYVTQNGLDLRATLKLFAIVCDAVNYAHQRGVIHRDLKPSNILVDEDGRPKVLDFGLARQHTGTGQCSVTMTDVVAGTLRYLSPEQALGEGSDVRSDVYALGLILYELATGRFPYPVDVELPAALRHIAETAPRPPSDCQSALTMEVAGDQPHRRCDDEVETIILKALAKERERRYQTAGELARDIERYLAGDPIDAKRDSGWYLVRKALRRHRTPAILASALAVLTIGAAVALLVMYSRQGRLLDEVRAQQLAAQRAEAVASERFAQLRNLANAFIQELDPKIQNLSGSAPARRFIVSKGLEYLNALAKESEGDALLQRQLASAYTKLGDVQGNQQRPNLGDFAGAAANYRKACDLLKKVAADQPDNVDVQRNLGACQHRLALALAAQGRGAESAEALAKAQEIVDGLFAQHPDDALIRRERGNLLEGIADGHTANGRYDQALAIFQTLLAEQEDARYGQPNKRDLAVCHYKIGGVHLERGDAAQALSHFARYVTLFEELAADEPDNALTGTDLGWGYERLALTQFQLGQYAEALASARRQLAVQLPLSADPDNKRALTGVRAAYCRIGEAQLALGQVDDAIESFVRFGDAARAIGENQQGDPAARREVAVATFKLAEVHMTCGSDENRPPSERVEHWQLAHDLVAQTRAVFEAMRDNGELAVSDSSVPEELAADMENCSREIAALSQQ